MRSLKFLFTSKTFWIIVIVLIIGSIVWLASSVDDCDAKTNIPTPTPRIEVIEQYKEDNSIRRSILRDNKTGKEFLEVSYFMRGIEIIPLD